MFEFKWPSRLVVMLWLVLAPGVAGATEPVVKLAALEPSPENDETRRLAGSIRDMIQQLLTHSQQIKVIYFNPRRVIRDERDWASRTDTDFLLEGRVTQGLNQELYVELDLVGFAASGHREEFPRLRSPALPANPSFLLPLWLELQVDRLRARILGESVKPTLFLSCFELQNQVRDGSWFRLDLPGYVRTQLERRAPGAQMAIRAPVQDPEICSYGRHVERWVDYPLKGAVSAEDGDEVLVKMEVSDGANNLLELQSFRSLSTSRVAFVSELTDHICKDWSRLAEQMEGWR